MQLQDSRAANGALKDGGGQKVSTCLWFDSQAEEAVAFYVSLLDDSRIKSVTRYGPGAPLPEGTALTVIFELAGTEYTALNGGPHFKLTEACSLVVKCESQAEIDRLWDGFLQDGGVEAQCGWLKDRFGLSWQVVPAGLGAMLLGEGAAPVFEALMGMVKIDIAALEAARRGGGSKGAER